MASLKPNQRTPSPRSRSVEVGRRGTSGDVDGKEDESAVKREFEEAQGEMIPAVNMEVGKARVVAAAGARELFG